MRTITTLSLPGLIAWARLLPLYFVMALSLSLLVFAGRGEAERVATDVELQTLYSQGQAVHALMDRFLQETWPLKDVVRFLDPQVELARYAGFSAFAGHDDGQAPRRHISVLQHSADQTPTQATVLYQQHTIEFTDPSCTPIDSADTAHIRCHDQYRIHFPLHNATGNTIGTMVVAMPTTTVTAPLQTPFATLSVWVAGLFLAFAALTYWTNQRDNKRSESVERYAYAITFTTVSLALLFTLINIYTTAIQTQADESADALGIQLSAIVKPGANFGLFEDRICAHLADYVQHNAVSAARLVLKGEQQGQLVQHRDSANCQWQTTQAERSATGLALFRDYTTHVPVGASGVAELEIVVPGSVVRDRVLRSAKNFTALFVATAFIAHVFLTLGKSFRRALGLRTKRHLAAQRRGLAEHHPNPHREQGLLLDLMQAVWFLAVFIEGLNASFLPHYLQSATDTAGFSGLYAAALFTAFFAAFVAVLAPAGRYAERGEIKHMMLLGMALIAVGMWIMSHTTDFYTLLLARILGGMGQGLTFIAVQSYILAIASDNMRTQGMAKQVFAQNSGVIAGAVIGALVVAFLSEIQIFTSGSVIALFTLLLIAALVPGLGRNAQHTPPSTSNNGENSTLTHIKQLIGDFEFIRALFLVGVTSKIVYNGIVFFAIPILMKQQGYPQEDIGQALMLFAAAVLIANHFVAQLADRFGNVAHILFIGMVVSGLGAVLVGMSDSGYANEPALIIGILLLGAANGFIAAPIVSHILDTPSANIVGKRSTVAIYRLLERCGHVVGPLIIGQLLIINATNASAVALVGAVVILFGATFFVFRQRAKACAVNTTTQ